MKINLAEHDRIVELYRQLMRGCITAGRPLTDDYIQGLVDSSVVLGAAFNMIHQDTAEALVTSGVELTQKLQEIRDMLEGDEGHRVSDDHSSEKPKGL